MLVAQELINQNGISQIALGFFTALLTVVGILLKMVYDDRKETRAARKEASKAAESAAKAVANTKNVSNGFAGGVLEELRQIREGQQDLSATLNRHLEWHIENRGKEHDVNS